MKWSLLLARLLPVFERPEAARVIADCPARDETSGGKRFQPVVDV
jgi:hypothetical protein